MGCSPSNLRQQGNVEAMKVTKTNMEDVQVVQNVIRTVNIETEPAVGGNLFQEENVQADEALPEEPEEQAEPVGNNMNLFLEENIHAAEEHLLANDEPEEPQNEGLFAQEQLNADEFTGKDMYGNALEEYPEEEDWKEHKSTILASLREMISKYELSGDIQIVLTKSAGGNKDDFAEYILATEEKRFSFSKISNSVNWNRKPHSKLMFDVEDYFAQNPQFKYFNGFKFNNYLKIGDSWPFPLKMKDPEFNETEFEPQIEEVTTVLFFHMFDPNSIELLKKDIEGTFIPIYGEYLRNRKAAKYVLDCLEEHGIDRTVYFLPKPKGKKEDILEFVELSASNSQVLLFDQDCRMRFAGQPIDFSLSDISFFQQAECDKNTFYPSKKAFLEYIHELNSDDNLVKSQFSSRFDICKQNVYSADTEKSLYKLFYPIHVVNKCSNKMLETVESHLEKIKEVCPILSATEVKSSSDKETSKRFIGEFLKNKENYGMDVVKNSFVIKKCVSYAKEAEYNKSVKKSAEVEVYLGEGVDQPSIVQDLAGLRCIHEFRSIKKSTVYPEIGSVLEDNLILTREGDTVDVSLEGKVNVILFCSVEMEDLDQCLEICSAASLLVTEQPDSIQFIPILRSDIVPEKNPIKYHTECFYFIDPVQNKTKTYFEDPYGGNSFIGLLVDKEKRVKYIGDFRDLNLASNALKLVAGEEIEHLATDIKADKAEVSSIVEDIKNYMDYNNSIYQPKIEFSYEKVLNYQNDELQEVNYKNARLNLVLQSSEEKLIKDKSSAVAEKLTKLKKRGFRINIDFKTSGKEYNYKDRCYQCDGDIILQEGFFVAPSEERPFRVGCEGEAAQKENLLYVKCQDETLLLTILTELLERNCTPMQPVDIEDPVCLLCETELTIEDKLWMSVIHLGDEEGKEVLFCCECFDRLNCNNIKAMQGFNQEQLKKIRANDIQRDNLIVKCIIQA